MLIPGGRTIAEHLANLLGNATPLNGTRTTAGRSPQPAGACSHIPPLAPHHRRPRATLDRIFRPARAARRFDAFLTNSRERRRRQRFSKVARFTREEYERRARRPRLTGGADDGLHSSLLRPGARRASLFPSLLPSFAAPDSAARSVGAGSASTVPECTTSISTSARRLSAAEGVAEVLAFVEQTSAKQRPLRALRAGLPPSSSTFPPRNASASTPGRRWAPNSGFYPDRVRPFWLVAFGLSVAAPLLPRWVGWSATPFIGAGFSHGLGRRLAVAPPPAEARHDGRRIARSRSGSRLLASFAALSFE